jgi:hypothetical protein
MRLSPMTQLRHPRQTPITGLLRRPETDSKHFSRRARDFADRRSQVSIVYTFETLVGCGFT